MKLRHCYLALCLLGIILPYSHFIPFLRDHGLDLHLFIEQLFANRISSFFGMDVIVSSLVLWVWVLLDPEEQAVPYRWTPLVGNLLVGVSLGLPLFLYLRESQRAVQSGKGRLVHG